MNAEVDIISIVEANMALAFESDEQAARDEADRIRREDEAHRSAVMRSAKEALMEQGPLDEGTAKKIISAIAKGTVPNVTINF